MGHMQGIFVIVSGPQQRARHSWGVLLIFLPVGERCNERKQRTDILETGLYGLHP